jgi:amino-acid N-acetyltransferase
MMNIRNARADDVEKITRLVNHYADKGMLLPKSDFKVYSRLQCFYVAEAEGEIVGCASLVVLWKDLAEICSLAVDEKYNGQGIGKELVAKCIERARELKIPQVIVLTYQNTFFEKMGFHLVDKDSFPRKLMWECLECPRLDKCDELAYLIVVE